jgi:hypothetical protein
MNVVCVYLCIMCMYFYGGSQNRFIRFSINLVCIWYIPFLTWCVAGDCHVVAGRAPALHGNNFITCVLN